MRRGLQAIVRFAALGAALWLGGCTIDNSGPVRSVWRPTDGKSTYLNVVYLTDRLPDAGAPGGYGTKWADAPSCGTAEAVIPPATLPGEAAQYGYVAQSWSHGCATGAGPVGEAVAEIAAQAKARHCNSVFLFIHGFHTGFDGAVLRAAQVAHDAQTGCAVAAFSWSAEIDVGRYAADLEHSEYAQPLLGEFLRELAASNLRVTILAHSMGDRLILATLAGFAHSRQPVKQGFIDELVLAAADVGADPANNDFAHLIRDGAPYAKRITVYASAGDAVLMISKGAHGGVARAGREPEADLQVRASDKAHIIDVIDASDAPADALDHSYFAMSREAIADMTLALDSVPTAERLGTNGDWKPTLVCGDSCGNDPRYALAVAPGRGPRLISRILVRLVPLIPFVQ